MQHGEPKDQNVSGAGGGSHMGVSYSFSATGIPWRWILTIFAVVTIIVVVAWLILFSSFNTDYNKQVQQSQQDYNKQVQQSQQDYNKQVQKDRQDFNKQVQNMQQAFCRSAPHSVC